MNACESHLNSKQCDIEENLHKYYIEVDKTALEEAKNKILHILEEGRDNEIITKEEFQAMNPINKNPGKFYCNFKVHKAHQIMKAPPERPIVITCGSITENIGKFVQHHINPLANKHETFLKDTPDFFCMIL